MRSECATRLVVDTPSSEDTISKHGDLGPHSRVANAIATLIKSAAESGGKVIGLEGGWGSGKSTVIKLVQANLSESKNCTFFVFDAWAHEGDPLRRTFLESLAEHFLNLGWVANHHDWQQRISQLARRVSSQKIRTNSTATPLGKVFGVSVLLLPIGVALISEAARKGIVLNPDLPFSLQLLLGFSMSFAPFLVLLLNGFRLLLSKGWQALNDSSNWAFLSGETNSTITQDSSESPNPTSLEFEKEFRQLLTDCLSHDAERKAVLVIDNLDRISVEGAMSIWSTLQIFLQDRIVDSERWFERLWLIVPYDPAGLTRLWRRETQGDENVSPEREKSLAETFLDKRIQIRFEVPPPVLSDWKDFMIDLVEFALPDHTREERLGVFRVFSRVNGASGAPTPREIKHYVNQIGAIHRQWQHEFPLEHIAYYVALRRRGFSVTEISYGLLDGSIPDENIRIIRPENMRENLAGLIFNVPATIGQQLLLAEPIMDAFTGNVPTRIQELVETHPIGFWPVLDELAGERFADQSPAALANVALCLTSEELKNFRHREEIRAFINRLRAQAEMNVLWAPLTSKLANGLGALTELVQDEKFSARLLNSIRKSFDEVSKASEGKADPVMGLQLAAEQITRIHPNAWPSVPFVVQGSVEDWIEVCSALENRPRGKEFISHLKPTFEPSELVRVICQMVEEGRPTESILATVVVSDESKLKLDWGSLISSLQIGLQQHVFSAEITVILFKLLAILKAKYSGAVQTVFTTLANNGRLAELLHAPGLRQSSVFKGWFMAIYSTVQPEFSHVRVAGNSERGYNLMNSYLSEADSEVASHIFAALKQLNELGAIWRVREARGFGGVFGEVVRFAAQEEEVDLFTPDQIINSWQEIEGILNVNPDEGREFSDLIELLVEKANLPEEIMRIEESFQIANSGLYLEILNANEKLGEFKFYCVNGLRALKEPEWLSEIESNSYALDLVESLQSSKATLELGLDLQDAIISYAQKIAKGQISPAEGIGEYISCLIDALEDQSMKNHLKNCLLNLAVESVDGSLETFIALFGDLLSEESRLIKESRVSLELFSELVKKDSPLGLQWLANLSEAHPSLLSSFRDKPAAENFKKRISSYSANADAANKPNIESIGRIGKAWAILGSK